MMIASIANEGESFGFVVCPSAEARERFEI